jgi:hypothetical protein
MTSSSPVARFSSVTLTFCFTPEHEGIRPHHTSPPKNVEAFAEFCAAQVKRYA